jgi:hypothetical protein
MTNEDLSKRIVKAILAHPDASKKLAKDIESLETVVCGYLKKYQKKIS